MSDRRELDRIPVHARVALRVQETGRVLLGSVKDIHLRGISILCAEPLRPGDVVELEVMGHIDQRAGVGPLKATLEVLRVEGETPSFEIAGRLSEVSLP